MTTEFLKTFWCKTATLAALILTTLFAASPPLKMFMHGAACFPSQMASVSACYSSHFWPVGAIIIYGIKWSIHRDFLQKGQQTVQHSDINHWQAKEREETHWSEEKVNRIWFLKILLFWFNAGYCLVSP